MGKSTTISCADSRGGLFDPSKSSSWNNTGIYHLELGQNLGTNDTAEYGSDQVELGLDGNLGLPLLKDQVVAALATEDYYLGMFGLSDQPTNFTDLSLSRPSFLTTLKARNLIPSLSWGYTAGARYRK